MSHSSSTVVVMDQLATADALSAGYDPQSALAHVGLSTAGTVGSVSTDSSANASEALASTVLLQELPVTGCLVLRAAKSAKELASALKSSLSLDLPERLSSSQTDEHCIRWMSPDEWLLTCPLADAYNVENLLRAGIKEHFAAVNVSGGYSVLILSGKDASNVLKKSIAYDVSERHFAPGKVINTVMAKAQVTLRALEKGQFEIIVRRSFADYLWLWLQRAGSEYAMQAVAVKYP